MQINIPDLSVAVLQQVLHYATLSSLSATLTRRIQSRIYLRIRELRI